jgi:phenylacetate-CoA ligase
MNMAQKIYWSMPYGIKCMLVNLAARKQSHLRFGEEYEALKRDITRRNSWSREQFLAYQLKRLRELIAHCAANVPYYRNLFQEINLQPDDITSIKDLRQIPVLTKDVIREHGLEMIDECLDRKKLLLAHTSGTTGAPMTYYHDSREFSAAFAYNAARLWPVIGTERRIDRSVNLCGVMVTHPNQQKPPFWVKISEWKMLYMSSYHLTLANAEAYADAMRRWQPVFISGYPSSVASLAQMMVELGLSSIPVKAVFTTAENISDHQREVIRQAFGCDCFSQYGCTEQVAFAAECGSHKMHISCDHSILEVLDENREAVPCGCSGTVIGTSLEKFVQPLIRLELGDRLSLSKDTCSCGSHLPLIQQVDGRQDDLLYTPDGRRIGRLDHVFKGDLPIHEAQIIQDSVDHILVRIVPLTGFQKQHQDILRALLSERLGPSVQLDVEIKASIERTNNGKLRAVICLLTPEEIAHAMRGER